MMRCMMARRSLAAGEDRLSGPRATARQRRLARHLVSCERCRSEQARLDRLRGLLVEAAPSVRMDADLFASRLMTAIQERRKGPAAAPAVPGRRIVPSPPAWESPAWAGFRPLAFVPALCLMLAAGLVSFYLTGQPIPEETNQMAAAVPTLSANVGEYQDALKPPREVPFSVEQDLVGRRRGTIPLTTYVLEPAPKDAPIVLASF